MKWEVKGEFFLKGILGLVSLWRLIMEIRESLTFQIIEIWMFSS